MGVLSKAASPVNMSSPEPAVEKMNGVERRPERLRDWLINQINSGKFRGLQWVDDEKTIFQVPWIHAKKRDYVEERDSALFKSWAIHTGKYKPQENKSVGYDPTTWKINFRCALNGLKDIMEMKECQTEFYRVYKVLPSAAKKKRGKVYNTHRPRPYPAITTVMPSMMGGEYPPVPSQDYCEGWGNPVHYPYPQPPMLPPASQYLPTICDPSTTVNQYAPTSECHGTSLSGQATYVGTIMSAGSYPHSGDEYAVEKDSGSHVGSPLVHDPDHGSRSPSHSPHSMSPASHLGDGGMLPISSASQPYHTMPAISSVGSMPDIPVTSSSCLMQPISQCCYIDQIIKEIETNQALSSPTMSPSMHQNEIQITVLYGSIAVHTEVVSCTQGCRIYFGPNVSLDRLLHPESEKLFGPPGAHQISLPASHPDSRAAEILNAMKRGLVLNVNNNDIYATALCKALVHHGGSPREASYPLAKEETYKVFDYANFVHMLENWSPGSPGSPYPTPFTIFSLGQSWGREGRHVAQNLINVIVTSLQAQRDLQERGVFRRLPSEELTNNMPNPFDVYEDTQLDALADIQLEQPQNNQRFELPGRFNLPQF